MIGRLCGQLLDTRPDEVLLDVGGVGYRLRIPLSTFYRLSPPPRGPVVLHVHTYVREDAIQLFGFGTADERAVFERLIGISGIGPRIALAVLSGIGTDDLERAIRGGERAALERIPGIGRKTAERMLLELKHRESTRRRGGGGAAGEHPGVPGDAIRPDDDATSALVNLGYSEAAASAAVATARRSLPDAPPLEDLLRAALRALVR